MCRIQGSARERAFQVGGDLTAARLARERAGEKVFLHRDVGKAMAPFHHLRQPALDQFARRQTGKTGKVTGDEIMDAYNGLLPASLKDQMPSLREWYDKLSDAIHAAREDDRLFEEARTAIESHFDIRRVFKVPETSHSDTASSAKQTRVEES